MCIKTKMLLWNYGLWHIWVKIVDGMIPRPSKFLFRTEVWSTVLVWGESSHDWNLIWIFLWFWLWVLQIKMSAEEKEELQEKLSPPQDQIVAVIGNADPTKAKLESKSSPRRGWSMAARKDRDCLPCLHSWSRPHLCLRLCFCKSWFLVRFFIGMLHETSSSSSSVYNLYKWNLTIWKKLFISGVLTDLLTQQLQIHP